MTKRDDIERELAETNALLDKMARSVRRAQLVALVLAVLIVLLTIWQVSR